VEIFFLPKSTPHPLGSLKNTPAKMLTHLLSPGKGVSYASKIGSGDSFAFACLEEERRVSREIRGREKVALTGRGL